MVESHEDNCMRGRCVVLSANQCLKVKDLPGWTTRKGGVLKRRLMGRGSRIPQN